MIKIIQYKKWFFADVRWNFSLRIFAGKVVFRKSARKEHNKLCKH